MMLRGKKEVRYSTRLGITKWLWTPLIFLHADVPSTVGDGERLMCFSVKEVEDNSFYCSCLVGAELNCGCEVAGEETPVKINMSNYFQRLSSTNLAPKRVCCQNIGRTSLQGATHHNLPAR